MRYLPALALLSGLTAFASAAAAEQRDALCRLVAELSAEMTRATGYPPPPGCPDLRRADLSAGSHGDLPSQAGEFDRESGAIVLSRDLDLADPFARSVLLHELVHAAQIRAGLDREVACLALLEPLAYEVQARYLEARGLDRQASQTRLLGLVLGRCPDSFTAYE